MIMRKTCVWTGAAVEETVIVMIHQDAPHLQLNLQMASHWPSASSFANLMVLVNCVMSVGFGS